MTDHRPDKIENNDKPRRKWVLRTLLCGVALAAVAVCLVLLEVRERTSPDRVRTAALEYLSPFFNGHVAIGEAAFSWIDGVTLYDVSLTPAEGFNEPALELAEMRLSFDLWSVLTGESVVRAATADRPTIRIIRDGRLQKCNISNLYRPQSERSLTSLKVLPSIELRDARVRVIDRTDEGDRDVEDLRLTIRGIPGAKPFRYYDMAWHGNGIRIASGRSRWDMQHATLVNTRGGLPWFSLEAVVVALSSEFDDILQWRDLLGISGNVRVSDYQLGQVDGTEDDSFVEIELDNATLSIPVDDTDRLAGTENRFLNFDDVDGTIRIVPDSMLAQFAGNHRGAKCSVTMQLDGDVTSAATLKTAAFEVEVGMEGFQLPDTAVDAEARFVSSWTPLRKMYRDYDPRGKVDVQFKASKPGGDMPLKLSHMKLVSRGADAICRWVPVPVTNVVGVVDINPRGVWIRDMCAERNEGEICVNAFLEEANRWSPASVHIEVRDIEFDRGLVEALPPSFRDTAWRFNVTGQTDATCDLHRNGAEVGTRPPWQSFLRLDFQNLSACLNEFPYDLDGLEGHVLVDEKHVQVESTLYRNELARVEFEGEFMPDMEGPSLNFEITGKDVLLDRKLMNALPEKLRKDLNAFQPRGRIDVACRVTRAVNETETTTVADVLLNDIVIRHRDWPIEFTDVSGSLQVLESGLVTPGLHGRRGNGQVSAVGVVERHSYDFNIDAENITIDEEFVGAVPGNVTEYLREWKIKDPVDFSLHIRDDETLPNGLSFELTSQLRGQSVAHPRLPEPLENVHASIEVNGNGFWAERLRAKLFEAEVEGSVRAGADNGEIKLSASRLRLGSHLRDLLPEEFRSTWEEYSPQGTVDLQIGRLIYERGEGNQRLQWKIEGDLRMSDVTFEGRDDIEHMSGMATLSGMMVDELGGTSLSGELSLDSAELMGWEVEKLKGSWMLARVQDGEGVFKADDLVGTVYGGPLAGELNWHFDNETGNYDVTVTAQDVDVTRVVDRFREADDEPHEIKGMADVHVYITGSTSNLAVRRGGGHIEIRDGHLYRLPVIVAILKVLNLSVPQKDAISEAHADFFIVDDTLEFRELVLSGRGVVLVGSGELHLPGRSIDVKLISVSPHDWMRVPALKSVVEGATRSIVEIHVVGPLARPIVRPRPFSGINDEFKKLFKKKKKRGKPI